jgi:hypothetical protein
MRARFSRPRASAVFLMTLAAGALVFAGCSSNGSPSSSSTSTSSSTSSTALPFTGPTGSGSSTTSTAASGGPQNLAASASVKNALMGAYVAHNGLPADEVAGTAPNSVYYAYDPSTKTYWAVAAFVPTKNASYNTEVAIQDEGCCGVFTRPAGGAWTYMAGFLGVPCPGQLPAAIESLWRLATPPDCAAGAPATTTTTS